MSFFDKKEEVVEIQLTQYGKHLLSRGKFSPKLYAFFDDDILYDSQYAGITEEQSETQDRIEDGTPRLKTQYVFSSREKEVNRLTASLVSGRVDLQDRIIQPTAERHYALSAPIGTSALGSSQAPAWKINFLTGKINSSVEFVSGAMPTLTIPQLNLEPITYQTKIILGDVPDIDDDQYAQVGDLYGAGSQGSFESTLVAYEDGSYVSIREEHALIDVRELNSDFANDNFDIEVFLVEEVDAQNNIVPLSQRGTIPSREKLYPLCFVQEEKYIKNGFLLDTPEGGPADEYPELDPNYVEYWFNIWVDDEIDERHMKAVEVETEESLYVTNVPSGTSNADDERIYSQYTKGSDTEVQTYSIEKDEECKD